MKREFFSDKRREARGGSAQMLELSCAKCGHTFFHYQKDGPGPLLRLYLDRIHAPKKFVGLQRKSLGSLKVIGCPDCGRLIAMPQMYKAEKRKAYRVFQGALKKKRIRLDSKF